MANKKKILILGGTGEARRLAALLMQKGYHVTTSLAGVTKEPLLPVGELRTGGFGGADGLAAYLREGEFAAICDATHPFAAQITRNGFEAAKKTGRPYVRVERRPWKPLAGERWQMVADVESAVAALPQDARVFVAIGRKDLDKFAVRSDLSVLARSIEEPDMEVPENWKFIQGRPPFTLAEEKTLMATAKINALVTKNSGGKGVSAKLQAARELGVKIIMIERPVLADIRKVRSVEQVLQFLPDA